jgi:hypothetical protein
VTIGSGGAHPLSPHGGAVATVVLITSTKAAVNRSRSMWFPPQMRASDGAARKQRFELNPQPRNYRRRFLGSVMAITKRRFSPPGALAGGATAKCVARGERRGVQRPI